jgi:photosystem II stability/assembly factor-like uncharacterized protein
MALSIPIMTSSSRLVTHIRAILLCALSVLSVPSVRAQSVPADGGRGQYEELDRIYGDGSRRAHDEEGEDLMARDAWFYYQRAYPYGMIPAGARAGALRASEAITRSLERSGDRRRASLLSATSWEPIGPTNQGGRILAIAMHPTSTGTFLVGAAAGGVWRTSDGGGSWQPTFDRESAIAIGSLAYDYTNPDIVYAGTGENFPSSPTLLVNTPSYLGDGVFKSTDGGATWKQTGLGIAGAVSKVFVHRQNHNIVYAAVAKQNGGFYRSTDAGATWKQTLTGDLYDMSVSTANSDELYVAYPSMLKRSTDGGLTFTTITSGMTLTGGVRFSVAVAPSDPARLYALVARGGGTNNQEIGEIYASTDRGSSWRLSTTLGGSFFNNQGVYDNFIVVHPLDANIVLAGGIDVYRTSNGGSSWQNVTRVYSGGDVHPDQHFAQFDPTSPNIVVLGNDGGVFTSLDGGVNWSDQSDGLGVTQFYRMDVDQTRPFRVYGGTQDNGTSGSFGTTGFTNDWTSVLGGDGFFVATDQGDPNYFYGEIYYGTLYRISATSPGQRSRIDGGIPTSGADADEGNWATPIAMSAADRKSLYSGRANLWRTTDRGAHWTKIPVGLSAKIAAIGLSPTEAEKLVVGSLTGQVRYSTDYGATWTTARGLPGAVVTDLRFDPVVASRIYATFSGFGASHVFRSDDYGATWTNLTANLPVAPANAIEIDPKDNTRLFVATDIGVFFSPNSGRFWIPFTTGLPLAPVADLRIHRGSDMLIAATHGRSMFRIAIDNIVVEPTIIAPTAGARVTTPGTLTVRWFGFDAPVNVFVKYSSDEPYVQVASGVTGDSVAIAVPMRLSTTARVRVEEVGSGRSAMSEFFTLVTPANATSLGRRQFTAEAIEMRAGMLWATSRGSDSIYRLRLPLLTGGSAITRSGFTGTIRDLAYDPVRDEFFALVAGADGLAPQIYRMDTNARSLGALSIPPAITAATGIAMRGNDLVVATPAPSPTLWFLDPETGAERSHTSIVSTTSPTRRGLVWNGHAYVQGAELDSGEAIFGSELEQIDPGSPARVIDDLPVVLPTGDDLAFFGLAYDPGSSGTAYYFATDTSGVFYRMRADELSGVAFESSVDAGSTIASAVVRPNPASASAAVDVVLGRAASLTWEIIDPSGSSVIAPITSRLDLGRHELRLDVSGLSSGLYYVVIAADGARVIRALSVVR